MKKFLSIGALLAAALAAPQAGAQGDGPKGDGDTPIVISDGSILVKFLGDMLPGGTGIEGKTMSDSCWDVLVFTWRGGTPPAGLLSPVATYGPLMSPVAKSAPPQDGSCPTDVVKISLSIQGISGSRVGAWRAAPPEQRIALTHAHGGIWKYAAAFKDLTLAPNKADQYVDGSSLRVGVRIASVQVGSQTTTLDNGHSVIYLCNPTAPKALDQCPKTINPFLPP